MKQWTVERMIRTGKHTKELVALPVVATSGPEACRLADQLKYEREVAAGLYGPGVG